MSVSHSKPMHFLFFLFQITMDSPYIELTAVQAEYEIGPAPPGPLPALAGPTVIAEALASSPVACTILRRDPALATSAISCLLAAKAPGTVRGYSVTIRRYQAFCTLSGLDPLTFSDGTVMQFILHHDQHRSGFASLATIKPALSLLAASSGTSFSLSAATDLMLAGAKRRTRAAAGPVRKAPSLLPEDLSAVLRKVFPVNDLVGLAEPTHLRTAFRLLVEYHTLCRFACFRQL